MRMQQETCKNTLKRSKIKRHTNIKSARLNKVRNCRCIIRIRKSDIPMNLHKSDEDFDDKAKPIKLRPGVTPVPRPHPIKKKMKKNKRGKNYVRTTNRPNGRNF